MGTIQPRKMVLDKKFHKTGGSHIDFNSWGTFWEVKKAVITAALAGDFFNALKCGEFTDIFELFDSFDPFKILLKNKNGQFVLKIQLLSVFCMQKIPKDTFQSNY
jgi:hypothetical protein